MKPWTRFVFDGLRWSVYRVPNEHEKIKPMRGEKYGLNGACFFNDQEIYINKCLSKNAQVGILAHEIQHVIEDWANIEHDIGCLTDAGADQRTDMISKGWLYLLRHNPQLVTILVQAQ